MPARFRKSAACTIAALVLAAVPAPAYADNLPTRITLVPDGPSKQNELNNDARYWTENGFARMKVAMTSVGFPAPGAPPADVPAAAMTQGGPWDDLAKPWPGGQNLVSRTVGKLFMKMQRPNGTTYDSTCSANVVTSANKSVVLTAGHCLKIWVPGAENAVAANVVFVPAFDGASLRTAGLTPDWSRIAPHGVWVATNAHITWGWNALANWVIGHDMGALTVQKACDPLPPQNPPAAQTPCGAPAIQDALGGHRIRFGDSRDVPEIYAFGYPSDNVRNWYAPANGKVAPALQRTYDGRTMFFSKTTGTRNNVYIDMYGPSALSPGTSGGPWFESFDPATGTGVQTAVSSRFHDPDNAGPGGWQLGPNMVGQHLGDEERLAYEAAEAITVTQ